MAKTEWTNDERDNLIDMFYKKLKKNIKNEIIKMEQLTTFDKYITETVKIDNR